jgi:hypothetical protein
MPAMWFSCVTAKCEHCTYGAGGRQMVHISAYTGKRKGEGREERDEEGRHVYPRQAADILSVEPCFLLLSIVMLLFICQPI